ncbi:MAG TPA: AAA family ATPase [Hyphomicrobiales bacterium]|nr:AAA family ATPase [Hyphomicrobiales bacterium]
MYLDFFSLERHPFRITPDPSLFFHGGERGRGVVLDALIYGITSGEGILKVVGEVGSGKTMLCRMLEERLPDSVEIVYLANPRLGADDILHAIAFELKLEVEPLTDRLLVMQRLQHYLLQRHAAGGTVVVFIEEAQGMPLDTLEEIRLLSNLETHRHKLMQIVLFGQPELERKLRQKEIRQLRERITHSFNLDPLGPEEVREYLHYRLAAAGCPWPQLFSVKAEKLLATASGGLTRRINILADKALLAAYADPATRPRRNGAGEIQPMVQVRHVRSAIADSNYGALGEERTGASRYLVHALTLGLGMLIGALLLWWRLPDGLAASAPVESVPQASLAPASAAAIEPTPSAAPELVAASVPESIIDTALESVATVVEVSAALLEEDQEPAAAQETKTTTPSPAKVSVASPPPDAALSGVMASRLQPSAEWLRSLSGQNGYSIQMFAAGVDERAKLQDYFDYLALNGYLDRTYLCLLSANAGRPAQWLVFYSRFAALSEARSVIDALPQPLARHTPYARNLDDIACAETVAPALVQTGQGNGP